MNNWAQINSENINTDHDVARDRFTRTIDISHSTTINCKGVYIPDTTRSTQVNLTRFDSPKVSAILQDSPKGSAIPQDTNYTASPGTDLSEINSNKTVKPSKKNSKAQKLRKIVAVMVYKP